MCLYFVEAMMKMTEKKINFSANFMWIFVRPLPYIHSDNELYNLHGGLALKDKSLTLIKVDSKEIKVSFTTLNITKAALLACHASLRWVLGVPDSRKKRKKRKKFPCNIFCHSP